MGHGQGSQEALEAELAELLPARHLVVLLDYDGTLVPHAEAPDLALPDAELLGLLGRLAARRNTEVHIVSGRTAGFLDRALDGIPVFLHAEHGAFSRKPGGQRWSRRTVPSAEWQAQVLPLLADFARRTPGALVEFKETALAWHWRAADAMAGAQRATELGGQLEKRLLDLPVELLWGDHVLEIRPRGVHKGIISGSLAASSTGKRMLAAGNDRTDEDLFEALSGSALTIVVGDRPSSARYRVPDVWTLRQYLGRIADSAS
ncbi:MAG TPA: trehalose-phosphatase [Gemmatimonadales bacterium]